MVAEGVVLGSGRTRARGYTLAVLERLGKTISLVPGIREDSVWRQDVAPLLADLPSNLLHICQHGFTEMLNNTIDHSESGQAGISITRTAANVMMLVSDQGVGIFKKIQDACQLEDHREAIFELTKGKLTTDPKFHTGEGIFFTSRIFDLFMIASGNLTLTCVPKVDWLMGVEVKGRPDVAGTTVLMVISMFSKRTIKSVMDKFASGDEDYGFTKTSVPLSLAKYGAEQLVSRSQAKRVVAGLSRFKDVYLDFSGIETIGQAFADEVFPGVQTRPPDRESQTDKPEC